MGDTRNEDLSEVFGDFDPGQYEDEVRERWGDTEAYRQSGERTKRYRKQDWQAIKDEAGAIHQRLADLFAAGVAADSEEAMDAVEAHRRHIDARFYDCTHEMHVHLGEMYVADPRFTAFYDRIRPGLAVYARDAIRANAQRATPAG